MRKILFVMFAALAFVACEKEELPKGTEGVCINYENGIGIIKVIMLVSFFDYVVDANNRVLRGDNRYRVKNKYEYIIL